MALSSEQISRSADRRHRAETTRTQIRQLSIAHPKIAIDDANAIQTKWVEIKVAARGTIKCHRIGLTSQAMEGAPKIDDPDCVVRLDDMFFADRGLVLSDRFIAPRVEAELALIVSRLLAEPSRRMFDVLNATDFVVPALEILDTESSGSAPSPTRCTRSRPPKGDTIQADFGSYGSDS